MSWVRLVLQLFYRLTVVRENEENFFTEAYYAKMIYENWVFDVAKFLDLAAIYGESNGSIVKSIISKIVECQPNYLNDILESVVFILDVSLTRS